MLKRPNVWHVWVPLRRTSYWGFTPSVACGLGRDWDRMQTVRRLEQSLNSGNASALDASLVSLWPQIEDAALEVPFAHLFGERLISKIPQDPDARRVALSLGLLSTKSEEFAASWPASGGNGKEALLTAIALGNTETALGYNATSRAVIDGMNAGEVPVRLKSLMDSNRVGEAILRAIALYESGHHGNVWTRSPMLWPSSGRLDWNGLPVRLPSRF